jgi:hypothetical protein
MFRDDEGLYSSYGYRRHEEHKSCYCVRFLAISFLISLVVVFEIIPYEKELWIYFASGLEGIRLGFRTFMQLDLDWMFMQLAQRRHI